MVFKPATARPFAAFTLLEVLIALGVFSVAAGAFVLALTAGTTLLTPQRDHDETALHLRFAMRQIVQITAEEAMEDGGEFELPGEDGGLVRWEATIEPTNTLGLFRVTLEIIDDTLLETAFGREEPERVTIFLHRPNWGDAVENASLRDQKERDFSDLRQGR